MGPMGKIRRQVKPSVDGVRDADVRNQYINRLRGSLAVCPADIRSRCELAMLLEEIDQHEEALFHWMMALMCDSDSLVAREGFARCRRCAGF